LHDVNGPSLVVIICLRQASERPPLLDPTAISPFHPKGRAKAGDAYRVISCKGAALPTVLRALDAVRGATIDAAL
jgi:hypothetical protein